VTTSTLHLTNCPNCGAALDGSFCAHCGQKVTPINPPLHDFLHELAHEILHVDGKFLQSARLLLTSPGFLSREQFEGRRARYVSPIRLYLIFSVMYFAIAAFSPNTTFHVTITSLKSKDSQETAEQLEVRRQEMLAKANEALTHTLPRVMFVLVPLYAGLVALARRKSGRNYPQHLYFAMHVHAAWFFAGAIAAAARVKTIPFVTRGVPVIALIYCILYALLAFRRAYNVSVISAALRVLVVNSVYMVFVLASLLAIIFNVIFRS
jgi:uncharacterized protein DUF3667